MPQPREPRHKSSRRFGFDVYGTGGTALQRRIGTPPGAVRSRRRRPSVFGEQLTEKQKLKAIYGLDERALRRQFAAAEAAAGPTGSELLSALERRLDNVVYRLGLAKSRPMARQLVSHGHVMVDGKRVNIPSAFVDAGQRISLSTEAAKIPAVAEEMASGRPVADWLERDGNQPAGRVTRRPERSDVEYPIDESRVVGFYSR